nr:EAL domain-containing protein [uncultured Cohaesibacter sp.]
MFKKRVWHYANVPSLLATLVIFAVALIAEDISEKAYIEKAKADLTNKASHMAAQLVGTLIANLESGRGMANSVSLKPDMDEQYFNEVAKKIFHKYSFMTSIVLAPDAVVSTVYPKQIFAETLGMDLKKFDKQRFLIESARIGNHVTMSNVITLANGEEGILIYYPVFVDDPAKGRYFWGVVIAAHALKRYYERAGLEGDDNSFDYALYNTGLGGSLQKPFRGSSDVNKYDPITVPLDFKVAHWELRAVPKGGWTAPSSIAWMIRAVAFLAFLLIVVPMAVVNRLSRERMAYLNARIESERELFSVSKRFEIAVDALQLGVWEYDSETCRYTWDLRTREIFGVDADFDVNDHSWKERIVTEDRERLFLEGPGLIGKNGKHCTDYGLKLPDGQRKTVRVVTFVSVKDNGHKVYMGVNWDISEHLAREEALKQARTESEQRYVELNKAKTRIEFIALHDYLTRLPNRRYIDEFLNGEDGSSWPFDAPSNSWFLKIDLDGFKEINNSFGHAAGDAMLQSVADIMRSLINEGEFIARVGGDEFVILCSSADNKNRPQEIAERFIESLHRPLFYKGLTCRLGASIGISSWADAKGNVDRLRSNADLALYQSKQNGKGCFTFFSQPLFQNATEKRRMADDLLRGIENREFIAHYQGQYDAKTHKLAGVEALARWLHPSRGLVYPDMFIELADGLGVTGEIDAMVMEHAIETKKYWAVKGLPVERVSVNVSAKRLSDRELIPSLKALNFDPSCLTFELVESTFLDRSAPQVAANIRRLREMGIEIEIDDFGTAYASIVSLMHLLPNRLKIDRELIFPVTTSEHQRELVHSIIHIGRTLGIGVVAEGIETMEHAEILHVMGADLLQGYAFCKPMPREKFLSHHLEKDTSNVA